MNTPEKMKRHQEHVEATAQLTPKEDGHASSHESLNFGSHRYEPSDACNHASTRYRFYPSSFSQPWRRMESISLPTWLPIRKLAQLNLRFLVFVFAVSLVVTVFVVNPYWLSRPARRPPASLLYVTGSPGSAAPYERPPPDHNSKFCTTWPVDEDGNYHLDGRDRINRVETDSIAPQGGWQKPAGVKIIAMVFFGRKRYVDILDCYLQKNLASNGGYLDEVWFMVHTDNDDDIAWLSNLVMENQDYKMTGREACSMDSRKYGCLWEYAAADNTIYIKIDDDIIYIHPDTIPQLVHTRLAVPHAFAVSAHLVNSPITGMEQFHHNAIYPFVPDLDGKPRHNASETWRLSELDQYPENQLENIRTQSDEKIMFPQVPYRGHPFVLLSEDNVDLLHTSMGRYDQAPGGDFIAFSPVWKSWAMAAQQQYSLLYNLEKNRMFRYFFGHPATYPADAKGPDGNSTVPAPKREGGPVLGGEKIFDTQFRRYNLNFCALWGSDIREHLPMADDDEDTITRLIPRKTGRPFIIDTRAVVGHFSFFTQIDNIRQTDLLDRWRAFANEAVCAPTNLKKPWDLRCPDFDG